jgi:hypothetical protein
MSLLLSIIAIAGVHLKEPECIQQSQDNVEYKGPWKYTHYFIE